CHLRRLNASANLVLHLQPLENAFGNGPNDKHDPAPEPGNVDDIIALFDCTMDVAGDALGRGDQWQLGFPKHHARIDKAWLHRDDVNAAVIEAIAQALKKRREPALGRAVEVIALAPAVSGDRGKRAEKSLAALLKIIRQDV